MSCIWRGHWYEPGFVHHHRFRAAVGHDWARHCCRLAHDGGAVMVATAPFSAMRAARAIPCGSSSSTADQHQTRRCAGFALRASRPAVVTDNAQGTVHLARADRAALQEVLPKSANAFTSDTWRGIRLASLYSRSDARPVRCVRSGRLGYSSPSAVRAYSMRLWGSRPAAQSVRDKLPEYVAVPVILHQINRLSLSSSAGFNNASKSGQGRGKPTQNLGSITQGRAHE